MLSRLTRRGSVIRLVAQLASVALLLAGCTAPDLPEGRFACSTDADCPLAFVCSGNLCYSSASTDLGMRDLGRDGAVADLGDLDLGMHDLGPVDLGGADLGGADLGSADLGSADLGGSDPLDLGVDAGPPICVCPDDGDPCTNDLCVGGVCTHPARCGAGTTCCGGACVVTTSDVANCGACGNVCGGATPICCGGTCRRFDNANCGGCGVACGPQPRFECCGGSCQDTNTGAGCISCHDVCPGDTMPCCAGICGNTC